jgi:arsenate reductase (thioredoxin)
MATRPLNVLVLCTGNSARSILGEALLNAMGRGRFKAYSAGSHPLGRVNPLAIEVLTRNRIPTEGLRSKSWDEFAAPDSPPLDLVITVCDNAAGEVCPYFSGAPMKAHWGVPDPAAVEGDDARRYRAFAEAYAVLERRITLLVNLPLARLERKALQEKLDAIGTTA